MSNYTQKKFRSGTVWGQIGGRLPWPTLRTFPGWGGEIAPMLLGDRRPWLVVLAMTKLQAKFEVTSFSCSKYSAIPKFKICDHAHLRVVCHIV